MRRVALRPVARSRWSRPTQRPELDRSPTRFVQELADLRRELHRRRVLQARRSRASPASARTRRTAPGRRRIRLPAALPRRSARRRETARRAARAVIRASARRARCPAERSTVSSCAERRAGESVLAALPPINRRNSASSIVSTPSCSGLLELAAGVRARRARSSSSSRRCS